ncbi:PREDICTED: structural maintenance of chromosomes flexible hinge domain-containing protein 1-like [Acropora digitifera]|uniref:structural maintenance of chromosomes flexible hinge domain-containing protein 1-like n=1 Tax=Acropora digitifera TaxID=70779 RepID=UPI00077A5BC4|nr:PREDICTED: structural maintenance of chromosomes flexible hinge domain-containing protein 1-like [Acropora digitifera]
MPLKIKEASLLICNNSYSNRVINDCQVRGSTDESFKLDKPHSELMRYDVHPNALTQSGNYHFSASYQAFAEFIDNSIQATSINNTKDMDRVIEVHVFLKDKLVVVFDNGEGMTYEGLKAFATYFLSQADRGLEREEVDLTPGYLDGAISKFGVGATQAGFYLGDRIKVITKKDECPFVTEITISKEKLQQRAKEGKPVFEDYRWIRNPGDTSTLAPGEETRCLEDIIKGEAAYPQFTMIVISGIRDFHIDSIREDGGQTLARELAHVYHFYLFGERGRSGNMKLPTLGNSKVPPDFGMSSFLKVDIKLVIEDGRNSNQKKTFNLRDVDDDIESLYQTRAKDWFPFSLTMKVPNQDAHQTVQGVLMYFPHEAGHETLPRPDGLEDDDQEPIFECFWQGRLAPLSYVHRMEFCTFPAQRSKKQKDLVPDSCYRRLKGILFFNRHTPISNNKLKILLDERKDLSSALEDASTERRLPQEFRTWLEKCHRELDKEVSFDSPLPPSQQPKNGEAVLHAVLRVTTSSGVQVYKAGDVVKLDTKPIIYGKVLHFVKVSKKNDVDKVVVQRQPEEVYINQVEERPISRILEVPDQGTLRKVFNQEKQMLPKTVRVYKDSLSNELSSKAQLHWLAGETQKEFTGFWVKIFNGERPAKQLVALHNKRLCVRQLIEGPGNIAPVQNEQPHDGEKFGFKPFWLSVAGNYIVKYIAMMGEREMASTQFEIVVKANVASYFTLTEPSRTETPQLALGEPGLKFKLKFKDSKDNSATNFRTGEFIELQVTCPNLTVHGLKDKYKPNSDGVLEVSGIALRPNGSAKVQYGKDISVRVDVGDIDFVTFPVRIKAGEPQSVKIPQFDSNEVVNYEEFPEFTVQVLDQWNQPCSVSDRRTKLHAECEAFVGGPQLANIEHGQGRFPPIKVKLAPGKAPCTVKIKISLVSVDSVRRKITVSEVVRELKQFPIKILPSTLPHKVLICEGNENELAPANGLDKNGRDGRDCLELMAPAGSIVKGLFLKVFDESGRELSAEDFKASEPRITTSWSGEVPVRNLPYLPDCPVANLTASTFVGNVECVCNDVKCHSQIRIKPIAGEPEKWLFVSEGGSVEIACDSKKQLSQSLKIRVMDKLGNSAPCPPDVEPLVSVEHSPSKRGSTAVFIGNLIRRSTEFAFNNDSTICGNPGVITMSVYDKDNRFSKDTQRITLKPGAPHHIELKSQAFDDSSLKNEHAAKFFSNCFLTSPIHACVCDKSGNKSPLKTTLVLSWIPSSCGQTLSRKSTQKGEVMFEANTMKCGSRSGDQQVKLKVTSSEHKNLQPATVTATLEKSNRVKTVTLQVAPTKQTLVATDLYPVLQVECETEDNVRVDAVGHLSFQINRPDGTLQSTAVYRKPIQNEAGTVTVQPIAGRHLEESGVWSIVCQYTEYRERLKCVLPLEDHVTKSQPLQFVVNAGVAHRLELRFPSGSPSVLSASCTADLKGRTILPRLGKSGVEAVQIAAKDRYGNSADVSMVISVTIEPSGAVPDGTILPMLEHSPVRVTLNGGLAKLPRLTLCARVGNYIGDYLLVFSAPGVESHSVKFAFSTDEHIQRIQNELQPLRKQILEVEQSVAEGKRKANRIKSEFVATLAPVRSAFRGEPRPRDVVNVLQISRNQLLALEASETATRPAIVPQGPPARIRQYMKGIVAELAYVSDPLLARILSWHLQSKMSVALTSTTEQQRKVYDAGYSAYCEATILGFSKRDFDGNDGKPLPLELPSPPSNYRSPIEFAVNLLEFTGENGYLRCTLFWNLLSKTIVVKDLRSGQIYREHLTKMKQSCPTILTRDGNMIASDGLMDPKRRCPARLEDLKFAFGAMPARETAKHRDLTEKCEALEKLHKVCESHEKEIENVREREERLNEVKRSLTPKINELERELRKLRPAGVEKESEEPAEKRRKR